MTAAASVGAVTFGLSLLPICTEALLTFSCTYLMNSDFIRFLTISVEIADRLSCRSVRMTELMFTNVRRGSVAR